MTKHILSSLCAMVLVGWGGQPAQQEQAANPPVVHGYEISLPLSDVQYLPSAWKSFPVDTHWCIYYSDGGFQDVGPMNWGGGNTLYNVLSNSCIPGDLAIGINSGGHYQTVGHLTGYFSHIEPGKVRGTVELSAGSSYVLNASYVHSEPGTRIRGIYDRAITTPTGRSAVVRREDTFTLAPWRPVLEPFRGQVVTGVIGPNRVTWSLDRGRTLPGRT